MLSVPFLLKLLILVDLVGGRFLSQGKRISD